MLLRCLYYLCQWINNGGNNGALDHKMESGKLNIGLQRSLKRLFYSRYI